MDYHNASLQQMYMDEPTSETHHIFPQHVSPPLASEDFMDVDVAANAIVDGQFTNARS